jgi:hypothetical protein
MVAMEIEPGTSGSVVRNSDHYTTEVVIQQRKLTGLVLKPLGNAFAVN